ncbi:chemotaxis protein CheW [Oceanobacillus indicireducens]|uniref:Chemotaxis protein CheW n=1 Tax=Oceanobacillus indicireducens TaxID=1004261 RepID=A0A917XSY0_9BACI|nr:chemotaxis protein CheW [Oceanobacillus indicireducens]GGN49836.1 chemotaxis protein CheW [Oceanobacillus indicireducens]
MEHSTGNYLKVIVFQLQDEEYALPVEYVSAIERIQPITRVPRAEEFVKGVINLRGVIIPIIDLRLRFGMVETELTEENRIIIVKKNGFEVGLIVDTASDVIDLALDEMEPNPEVVGSEAADYIDGVSKIEDRLLILLDLKKILISDQYTQAVKEEGQKPL